MEAEENEDPEMAKNLETIATLYYGTPVKLPATNSALILRSAYGYKRTFTHTVIYVRFTPDSRRSSADVRSRPDFVCFTSRSRPSWWCRRRSVPDPKQTLTFFLKCSFRPSAPTLDRHGIEAPDALIFIGNGRVVAPHPRRAISGPLGS